MRGVFFNDIAALHYLADQLREQHRGKGSHTEVNVVLSINVPVPANRAKSFILNMASAPFFSREDYDPVITDIKVRKVSPGQSQDTDEEE